MTKLERIIITSFLFKFLVRKSKRLILPGFEGVPLYEVAGFFRKQLRTSSLAERASAISFNFIMSIPPTCLFLFTLIPNLPFFPKKSIQHQVTNLIKDVIPSKDYNAGLIKFVDSFFVTPKVGIISFGFVLLLFFASNAMMGVMRSFNKNYIGFQRRTGLQKRWTAIKLTTLLYSLLLACLILLFMQSNILTRFGIKNKDVKQIILYGKWVFIVGLIFYSYAFIYKYAPATQKRWRLISPGTIIATFLSILATFGFYTFVNNFGRYNALYSSIGTIIFVMVLVYINALIVLIGFEFNVSIKSLRAMAVQREKDERAKKSSIK